MLRHRNYLVIMLFLIVLLVLALPCLASAKGKPYYGAVRSLTPAQVQIIKHSVAANKHRARVANRTNRILWLKQKYVNGGYNYYAYYPRYYRGHYYCNYQPYIWSLCGYGAYSCLQ